MERVVRLNSFLLQGQYFSRCFNKLNFLIFICGQGNFHMIIYFIVFKVFFLLINIPTKNSMQRHVQILNTEKGIRTRDHFICFRM